MRPASGNPMERCKVCHSLMMKLWRKANPDKCRVHFKNWYRKSGPEYAHGRNARIKIISAKYRKNNTEKVNARTALRRARQDRAVPGWANHFFINEIYDLARLRTRYLGVKHHVDHIVPMHHSVVCGLHVEHNLRVIPEIDNIRKKNLFWPDMP